MNRVYLLLSSRLNLLAIVAASLLFVPLGCNRAPYDIAPVEGMLTLEGQPLADCQVMFAPRAKSGDGKAGKPAIGTTRSDGSFTLSTYSQGDGAVIGEHLVTLYGPENKSALPSGVAPFGKVTLRKRSFRVDANGDNQFEIALTAEDLQTPSLAGRQARR